jgi:glycosyltransferase involved in cell wall biosynthesis
MFTTNTPRAQRSAATETALASSTHVVLIPSYNAGSRAVPTVLEALRHWQPVWVVVDGSNDGSGDELARLAQQNSAVRVWQFASNRGKGAAILHGLREAAAAGYTHVLTMDSDGQHPADHISAFMAASQEQPQATILGEPVFDHRAPRERVVGRRISNWWVRLETLGAPIHDSLFGFRVYPVAPLLRAMRRTRWMRRFDFDAEAAVRLAWAGVPFVNLRVPVRYFSAREGGVSHFRYVRDNLVLGWMHVRLVVGAMVRLPLLLARKARTRSERPSLG